MAPKRLRPGGEETFERQGQGNWGFGLLDQVFWGLIWGLRFGWRLSGGGGTRRGQSGTPRAFRGASSSFFARILVILRNNAILPGPS